MTAAPSSTSAIPIDPRIRVIASGIAAAIPGAQIRLFGSRARGTSRPDSDVDLLITVPDEWLAGQDRLRGLGDLWRQHSSYRSPLDLLLYSETEESQHAQLMLALFGFRDSRIGFRLQQACEKALKGWIHAKGGQAPSPTTSLP